MKKIQIALLLIMAAFPTLAQKAISGKLIYMGKSQPAFYILSNIEQKYFT